MITQRISEGRNGVLTIENKNRKKKNYIKAMVGKTLTKNKCYFSRKILSSQSKSKGT